MELFVEGRKNTFPVLFSQIKEHNKVVWFHSASLGEFEQGLPIMEVVKKLFPNHKLVVSFFSPSGYEIKKTAPVADAVVYLPLDTPKNAKKFMDAVHPALSIFIKYDFWPNYLRELKRREIPALLVSGSFRKEQLFFKSYGGWLKNSLKSFDHFFVQNETSKNLLASAGFQNVTVSGDTRFDRVSKQLALDNTVDFAEEFKGDKLCIVAGSTWPEDEELLREFINSSSTEIKFIIAPHNIKPEQINKFRQRLNKSSVLYSEKDGMDLYSFQILFLDTIGLLSKVYSYANIAYVGGAAGETGLHNILEPATFGIPIVIGNNFEKFPEAKQLQHMGGLFSVSGKEELAMIFKKLVDDGQFRRKTGMIAGHYINSNTGATRIIEAFLTENYC